MGKYSKAIGAVIGGVVGVGLVAFGLSDGSSVVPATYQPAVDSLVTVLVSAIGTYLAPKNTN